MRPKKVILVVKTDESALSVLTYMLGINGYRVLPAASGQEAIDIFARRYVDLTLADVEMEPMNGIDLAERLKQIGPHIPVALLGDTAEMSDKMHAADIVINSKTAPTAEILERIKIMTARKRGPRKGTLARRKVTECLA